MIKHYDLIISKNGKIVAIQDITNWTVQDIAELCKIEEEIGRTCWTEIRKEFIPLAETAEKI